MNSIELILAIKEYAKRQGVDFEIALKMLGMMYEDGVHLDGGYDVKEPNIASNKDGSIGSYTGSYYWLLTNQKPYYGNWKDSLEERPNE